jgi:hypothetical protein
MLKRLLILAAVLASPLTTQAALIDFTDISWKNAITAGGGSTATIDNVTLTATGGYLTFNGSSSEQSGCAAGQPDNGLTCDGDGIGINNDEITQGGNQTLTISFLDPVNVDDIFLLDLFGDEGSGEIAKIDGVQYSAPSGNGSIGGFFATGFSAEAITSIMLTGNLDCFSDYALAAIEVSPVPLPGAVFLFGSALLGLFGFRRFA